MAEEGVEPSRPNGRKILNLLRLPFRHSALHIPFYCKYDRDQPRLKAVAVLHRRILCSRLHVKPPGHHRVGVKLEVRERWAFHYLISLCAGLIIKPTTTATISHTRTEQRTQNKRKSITDHDPVLLNQRAYKHQHPAYFYQMGRNIPEVSNLPFSEEG